MPGWRWQALGSPSPVSHVPECHRTILRPGHDDIDNGHWGIGGRAESQAQGPC